MTSQALLLVTTDPVLETLLLQRLHTPPLTLRARASSVRRAIERAARGDIQTVVITAGTRDLTPATLAELQRSGLAVVIITSPATDQRPLPVESNALQLPITALHASAQPLIDLLQPLPTGDGTAASALTGPAIPWSRRWQSAPPPATDAPAPPEPVVPAVTGGRLIALLSIRGGSGGSFVARGLAAQLARSAATAVWLLDLDPAGDSQVESLSLTTQTGLTPLAIARPGRAEDWRAYLAQELTAVGPTLQVLPGLARPTDAVHLSLDFVTGLLDSARLAAGWTLLDLGRLVPPVAAPWQSYAQEQADLTLLVVRSHWPSLLVARRVLTELAPDRPIGIVLNDVENQPTADELTEIGQALERPVVAVIPSERAAVLQPLLLTASPARLALAGLADHLRQAAATAANSRSTLTLSAYVPPLPASGWRWLGRRMTGRHERPTVVPAPSGGLGL